ncbi:hypothetical protein LS482_07185 [Sinomicrobium kalidii]|uniref:FGGY-family carbohydrate kinase n=1 Tax=Sinomicrobium kalidii TaxID=2900738 RepID=UPI001E5652C3|nr:FGGY family carbohydrate kinase [Sinomicrobium kalidii]UGU17652.1 hypothetical protein LS482_07185 [Sinomicrobium kalidii]
MNTDKTLNYLVTDIGTGNVRVALIDSDGELKGIERDEVHYHGDNTHPEALCFDPGQLWDQIMALAKKLLSRFPDTEIKAITASSQREGIVLTDREGHNLIGLPNHDHRGREWESVVTDPEKIYRLCGRYPGSIFSALKLYGIKKKRTDLFDATETFMSISDWAQYQFSGVTGYEHSQASETLLYDVSARQWSAGLCREFDINPDTLPPLRESGTLLGTVLPEIAEELGISTETEVIVGGADTQLAIHSTRPETDDVIVVAGTTTPIVKLLPSYTLDPRMKTWTGRHTDPDHFVLETNAGVTGLNYQRLKSLLYPDCGYERIEEEMKPYNDPSCTASLGSLIASETNPITSGGFRFSTPLSDHLKRSDFMLATLWDMAFCIAENYKYLQSVNGHDKDYIWGCGGGFQSATLAQILSDVLQKKIRIHTGFEHATIAGAAYCCNQTYGLEVQPPEDSITEYTPKNKVPVSISDAWQQTRRTFTK